MKLLFDNNLSVKLPSVVLSFFPESKHVSDLRVDRLTDLQIFEFAAKNNFTIATKDKDFYHLVNTFGSPPKVIWISVGNCANKKVIEILVKHQKQNS